MVRLKISAAILGIACLVLFAQNNLMSEETKDYHYSEVVKITGCPQYNSVTSGIFQPNKWELKHTLRMIGYRCSDLNPQQTDKDVRTLRDQGFTIVFSEANRYLFKDQADEVLPSGLLSKNTFDQVIKDNRILADACHKYGLKMYLHQTATMVSEKTIAEHPEWAAIDLETGKSLINAWGSANSCINNDDFMAEFYKRLNRVIKESDADGIMQDEIQFFSPTLCGCKWCREKFKKETGFEIPPAGKLSGWLYQFTANQNYAAWLKWRRDKTNEHSLKVRNILIKYRKDGMRSTYLCMCSACYQYYSAGLVVEDFPIYADIPGYEFEPPFHLYRYYNPLSIAEMKYVRAVSENMDSGYWTLSYDKTAGDNIWNWYLSMSQGSRRYWLNNTEFREKTTPFMVAWERDHEKILGGVKSAANIGVLFSLDSRDRNPEMSSPNAWMLGFMSTCHALSLNHVPYRVLVEDDMTAKELSKTLKTLILFNTGSLSARTVEAIREFVKNGGTLIASADTSLYDENGKIRSDFALSDVFGASFSGFSKDKNTFVIPKANPVTGEVIGNLKHESPFVMLKDIAKDVKVYGSIVTDQKTEYPGMLVRNYGKGKVVYFAGHPENKYLHFYYNQTPMKPGEFWKDNRDPQYGELICNAAVYGNNALPMEVDNLPRGIIAEVYNHRFGKCRGIQVHLANFLGGEYKEGMISPLDDVSFPDVMAQLPKPGSPIKVAVRAKGVKGVYLISPDFDGAVKLPFNKEGSKVNVDIPVFYRYSIVYFNQGDESEILRACGKILSAIPPDKGLVQEILKPLVGEYNSNAAVAFADSKSISGGLDTGIIDGEFSRAAYGSKSNVSIITAKLKYNNIEEKQFLDVGGMDDNGETKCPIQIRLNGTVIFSGISDYKDNKWEIKSYAIESGILKAGENTVEITNTGNGPASNLPWFAVNFLRLRSGK